MKIDSRILTNLKPDFYNIIPSFSQEELEIRLQDYPFHLATLLTVNNIRKVISSDKCKKGLNEFLSKSFEIQRGLLCEVLESRGFSENILSAFRKVKREFFASQNYRQYSYLETYIPFTKFSCLSSPFVVAIMIEKLRAQRGNKILEIGIGSGYHACCIVELLGRDCEFIGVEVNPEYFEFGKRALVEAGYTDIILHFGNEYELLKHDQVSFDRIYTASALEIIPSHIIGLTSPEGIFQGTRPLTRLEFDSEIPTSWLRQSYKTYEEYMSSDWHQKYACLATYQKKDNMFREIDRVYDVAFVPYRISPFGDDFGEIKSFFPEIEF
jgi:protein-L-isoaspartate(D-aspartate) O-methyltransferase